MTQVVLVCWLSYYSTAIPNVNFLRLMRVFRVVKLFKVLNSVIYTGMPEVRRNLHDHLCHMRKRIHVYHMRRRIHVSVSTCLRSAEISNEALMRPDTPKETSCRRQKRPTMVSKETYF